MKTSIPAKLDKLQDGLLHVLKPPKRPQAWQERMTTFPEPTDKIADAFHSTPQQWKHKHFLQDLPLPNLIHLLLIWCVKSENKFYGMMYGSWEASCSYSDSVWK
jgi:hypothetical protein